MKHKSIYNKIKNLISVLILMTVFISGPLAVLAASPLDEQTKTEYYQEYTAIAQEISKEAGIPIRVVPFEKIQDSQWMTPEQYRLSITEFASKFAAAKVVAYERETVGPVPGGRNSTRSTVMQTKTGSIIAGNNTYNISITGTFTTQYNSSSDRQFFSGVTSITSASADSGSWSQISADYYFADTLRTACLTATGWYQPDVQL